jgi:hypothetical protein
MPELTVLIKLKGGAPERKDLVVSPLPPCGRAVVVIDTRK